MKGRAYSPSHINGFFEIVDNANPLAAGSRGAGVCLEAGATTTITAERSSLSQILIKINGKREHAPVTRLVAKKMLAIAGEDYNVEIEQKVEVPIGAGFGSSGAGALSAALAINRALRLGLSGEEAARAAHLSEIECKTGLGTVLAEFGGGAVIRMKAGAPGIGSVSHFDIGDENVVGAISFGRLPTESFLVDQATRLAVKGAGGPIIKTFLSNPDSCNFLKLSQQFAVKIGRVSEAARAIIEEGAKCGLTCSVAMFGETIFSLVSDDSSHLLRELFEGFSSDGTMVFSHISEGGARVC